VNGKAIMAKLIDYKTTRDFLSLLPLTLTMNDLCRREKFANLPRMLSNEGNHKHTYAVGEIAYWPPGPDLAIFYRHDDESIPEPGIIAIGKVRSRIEVLNVPRPVKMTVELIG
jgi:hypothetical protein